VAYWPPPLTTTSSSLWLCEPPPEPLELPDPLEPREPPEPLELPDPLEPPPEPLEPDPCVVSLDEADWVVAGDAFWPPPVWVVAEEAA
jgi:hypothetical protein